MERREGVIVVGAGPVGFLTALGLARNGIPVTLLEAEAQINESPRAAVYFPTTVKILERLGLLPDAVAIGVKSWTFTFRVPSTGTIVAVDNRLATPDDHENTYNLHFGQHILARLVMQHLQRFPQIDIRWNTRVVGLKQDAKSVTVIAETPDGPIELQADWVVGTDGARSGVRNALGLPFEGHTWPDRFVATNLYYDFKKHGFGPANMVSDPIDWAVVAVLGKDDMWRVTYGEDVSLAEEEARRRIPERYAKILPDPTEPYEIAAASPYRVHERCAPTFRVGRALLAGDAAHVCNPCGGMGLTTGVIDAMALVDTLSAVIAGRAPDSVLDFYSRERRRVYLEVTSPLASDFKRMLSEKDPARREQDVQVFRNMVENAVEVGTTQSMVELIQGKPMPV